MEQSEACPVCGDTFPTRRGMHVHKSHVHRRPARAHPSREAADNAMKISGALGWLEQTGTEITPELVREVTLGIVSQSCPDRA